MPDIADQSNVGLLPLRDHQSSDVGHRLATFAVRVKAHDEFERRVPTDGGDINFAHFWPENTQGSDIKKGGSGRNFGSWSFATPATLFSSGNEGGTQNTGTSGGITAGLTANRGNGATGGRGGNNGKDKLYPIRDWTLAADRTNYGAATLVSDGDDLIPLSPRVGSKTIPAPKGQTEPGEEGLRYQNVTGRRMLEGTQGIMLAGANVQEQHSLFFPTWDHVLVAQQDGEDGPAYSTRIVDVAGRAYDKTKVAGLHSLIWVKHVAGGRAAAAWNLMGADSDEYVGFGLCVIRPVEKNSPNGAKTETRQSEPGTAGGTTVTTPGATAVSGSPGSYGAGGIYSNVANPNVLDQEYNAINGTTPGSESSGSSSSSDGGPVSYGDTGVPSGDGILAYASWDMKGPFHPGERSDKHRLYVNKVGEPVNPVHLWTEALWIGVGGDGPLMFEAGPHPAAKEGSEAYNTHLRWDAVEERWRWHTTIPMYTSDPPSNPPPKQPPPEGGKTTTTPTPTPTGDGRTTTGGGANSGGTSVRPGGGGGRTETGPSQAELDHIRDIEEYDKRKRAREEEERRNQSGISTTGPENKTPEVWKPTVLTPEEQREIERRANDLINGGDGTGSRGTTKGIPSGELVPDPLWDDGPAPRRGRPPRRDRGPRYNPEWDPYGTCEVQDVHGRYGPKGYVGFHNEVVATSFAARPSPVLNADALRWDSRYDLAPTPEKIQRWRRLPTVARLEAFGHELGGGLFKTVAQEGAGSRLECSGGSTVGGYVVTPPEIGMEHHSVNFRPAGVVPSDTYFGVMSPYAAFAAGTPDPKTGRYINGWIHTEDGTGDYVFGSTDRVGTATREVSLRPGVGPISRTYLGFMSGTESTALLAHSNRYDRVYAFPDEDITVEKEGHGYKHQAWGSDPIGSVKSVAYGIPMAGEDGKLDPSWFPQLFSGTGTTLDPSGSGFEKGTGKDGTTFDPTGSGFAPGSGNGGTGTTFNPDGSGFTQGGRGGGTGTTLTPTPPARGGKQAPMTDKETMERAKRAREERIRKEKEEAEARKKKSKEDREARERAEAKKKAAREEAREASRKRTERINEATKKNGRGLRLPGGTYDDNEFYPKGGNTPKGSPTSGKSTAEERRKERERLKKIGFTDEEIDRTQIDRPIEERDGTQSGPTTSPSPYRGGDITGGYQDPGKDFIPVTPTNRPLDGTPSGGFVGPDGKPQPLIEQPAPVSKPSKTGWGGFVDTEDEQEIEEERRQREEFRKKFRPGQVTAYGFLERGIQFAIAPTQEIETVVVEGDCPKSKSTKGRIVWGPAVEENAECECDAVGVRWPSGTISPQFGAPGSLRWPEGVYAQTDYALRRLPVMPGLEPFGKEPMPDSVATCVPGAVGRMTGVAGATTSGLVVLPPELSMEHAAVNFQPAGVVPSNAYLGVLSPYVAFASGIPDVTTGGFKNGWAHTTDDQLDYVFVSLDSKGVARREAALIPDHCLMVEGYVGFKSKTGQPAYLHHDNSQPRKYFFPDRDMVVENTYHASKHRFGGSDPIATTTPGAFEIPMAGNDGRLDLSWLPLSVQALVNPPVVETPSAFEQKGGKSVTSVNGKAEPGVQYGIGLQPKTSAALATSSAVAGLPSTRDLEKLIEDILRRKAMGGGRGGLQGPPGPPGPPGPQGPPGPCCHGGGGGEPTGPIGVIPGGGNGGGIKFPGEGTGAFGLSTIIRKEPYRWGGSQLTEPEDGAPIEFGRSGGYTGGGLVIPGEATPFSDPGGKTPMRPQRPQPPIRDPGGKTPMRPQPPIIPAEPPVEFGRSGGYTGTGPIIPKTGPTPTQRPAGPEPLRPNPDEKYGRLLPGGWIDSSPTDEQRRKFNEEYEKAKKRRENPYDDNDDLGEYEDGTYAWPGPVTTKPTGDGTVDHPTPIARNPGGKTPMRPPTYDGTVDHPAPITRAPGGKTRHPSTLSFSQNGPVNGFTTFDGTNPSPDGPGSALMLNGPGDEDGLRAPYAVVENYREHSYPAISFKAIPTVGVNRKDFDTRYDPNPSEDKLRNYDKLPIVARLEPWGREVGGGDFVKGATGAAATRYKGLGRTASGGLVITPPEIGMEHRGDAFAPTGITASTVHFIGLAAKVYIGSATPDPTTGGIKNGWTSITKDDLTYELNSWSSAGSATQEAVHDTTIGLSLMRKMRWKAGTSYYGLLSHANTGNRTYTFPDADGTVAITSDLSSYQPLHANLTSWSGVTRAAGFDTFVTTPSGANLESLLTSALPASKGGTGLTALSANIVTLLGAADYSAMRTQLSLVVGTNVQAYDATLGALSGLATGANKVPYSTGADTFSQYDISATPGVSTVPVANGSGKLASGWGGAASTLATLDGSSKVVEDPANATATPTSSKIPIANGSGNLAGGWVKTTKKGASSGDAYIGGTINTQYDSIGNVGGGEDDLHTFSVPASTLGTDGDALEFEMFGTFSASVNNKTVKVYFGSTAIFDSSTFATSLGATWRITGTIVRTGAATQRCIAVLSYGTGSDKTLTNQNDATETLSGAVTLKTTATDAGSTNDAIVEKSFRVSWRPAYPA